VWKAVLTLDRSRKMKVAVCYFGSLFALLARLFMSPYTVLVSDCYSELNRFSYSASLLCTGAGRCPRVHNININITHPTQPLFNTLSYSELPLYSPVPFTMLDGPYRYDPSYSPPDPRYIAENGMERLGRNTASICMLYDSCCNLMKMRVSS
jgi:hypothetical protein